MLPRQDSALPWLKAGSAPSAAVNDREDLLHRFTRPGSILSPLALRHLKRALARDPVSSDALLHLADMAEEAASSMLMLPWCRRDFRQLADVLRLAAPAFAANPLPRPQDQALPPRALRGAAGVLIAFGSGETAGVARMLNRMAERQGEWPT